MPKGHSKNANNCRATPCNLATGKQIYNYRVTQIALNGDTFNAVRERAIEDNTSFSEQIRILLQRGLEHGDN